MYRQPIVRIKPLHLFLQFVAFGLAVVPLTAQVSAVITGPLNQPVQDAYIINVTSGGHTHSDEFGVFEIPAEHLDTIVIRHLAYATRRIVVDTGITLSTVTLKSAPVALEEITISPKATSSQMSDLDLRVRPVRSSQEILRVVPGLFVAQHAGGGKAEQIFLRGFDIDHGTDVAINVDGMPVNLVSHAHGQGYADLHFLIPEIIETIDFEKGPYAADQGNFATAGHVNFRTKNRLDQSFLRFETGSFAQRRLLGGLNLLEDDNHQFYAVAELNLADGPFESPQNLQRRNLLAKYRLSRDNGDHVSLIVSRFTSSWDASGQIPQRAVDKGQITRFGAIDDTEGGTTHRTNLMINHSKKISGNAFLKSSVYYSIYGFDLFSNFTFYLEDPEHGDQIRQYEERSLFGFQSTYHNEFHIGQAQGMLKAGGGLRHDISLDNTLAHTMNRKTLLSTLQSGDVRESNLWAFAEAGISFGQINIRPGVRIDHFDFNYSDHQSQQYESVSVASTVASPKLTISYRHAPSVQFYAKAGYGFHSNDTRVVVARGGQEVLPKAFGADLGFTWKAFPRLIINGALWHLHLEQEFVYVGDAGVVEPSGASRRMGFDIGARWQIQDWLFFDTDINYSHARSIHEPDGENYIPLAPDLTSTGGLTLKHPMGISGGLRYRFLSDRPADELNSVVATGYTLFDLNLGYTLKHLELSLALENVLDVTWNETQFLTMSRLQVEDAAVEEIHFTPGTPRALRASIKLGF